MPLQDAQTLLLIGNHATTIEINTTNPDTFRAKLRDAGFYKEWRGKFGEDNWKILEAAAGALA